MSREDYYERQAARAQRARERSERLHKESTELYREAITELKTIPMGQPILIGHHSEKGHRAHLKRLDNKMRKSSETYDRATYNAEKAEAIEANVKHAISSDAPDAVQRLRRKIEDAERTQAMYKAINATIRKHKKAGVDAQVSALVELEYGISEHQARKLIEPDFCGRVGCPDYQLQNNNANIRRMKQRLEQLEVLESRNLEKWEGEAADVEADPEDNRVRVIFPGKPDDETRTDLKRHGFKWARSVGAWQRFYSPQAIYHAKRIAQVPSPEDNNPPLS